MKSELKELIQKAEESGTWESYYLLKVHEYMRPNEQQSLRILSGKKKVKVIELGVHKGTWYDKELLVIPMGPPPIVVEVTNDGPSGEDVVYVFTAEGWVSVPVN